MAEVGNGGTSEDLPSSVNVLNGMYPEVLLGTSSHEPLSEEQQCQKARAPGAVLGDFHAHDVQGTAQEDQTPDSAQGGCPVTVPLASWIDRDDRENPSKDEGKNIHLSSVQSGLQEFPIQHIRWRGYHEGWHPASQFDQTNRFYFFFFFFLSNPEKEILFCHP